MNEDEPLHPEIAAMSPVMREAYLDAFGNVPPLHYTYELSINAGNFTKAGIIAHLRALVEHLDDGHHAGNMDGAKGYCNYSLNHHPDVTPEDYYKAREYRAKKREEDPWRTL